MIVESIHNSKQQEMQRALEEAAAIAAAAVEKSDSPRDEDGPQNGSHESHEDELGSASQAVSEAIANSC